jgi:glycosyltransferase involved in cell wall biosynthesis
MKLLYTLTAYPPSVGGAQIHQHLLAQQLQQEHQIQVVSHWNHNRTDWLLGTTLRAPSLPENYSIDGIPVHRLGLSRREKLSLAPVLPIYYPLMPIALSAIAAVLEQHLAPYARDAELIHNVRIGREGLSYASVKVARKLGIPFVFTPLHHPRWVGWRYQAYIKLYQQADAVIALTQAEKQTLIELGVSEQRITITGIGPVLAEQADPVAFKKAHSIADPIVLFLGQHYPYKGYQQMLQATRYVWQKIPDTQFVFIGPAVGQSEQHFAAFSDSRIHRLGKVDLQEKTNAIAACTLLCVPSIQESFGGVYTEAWSLGKPVIGCNIPAVSEVISDGVDGFLVAQELTQIAQRICDLLLDSSQAQAMGAAGQGKVANHYNWQRIAELTEQTYHHAVGSPASQSSQN